MSRAHKPIEPAAFDANPLWYTDSVIYELHVRAFCDGNGDGIGDFIGLTTKLDYLRDLDITAIWLLPFYPSPLRDDGYDITDYTGIHPDYGTLRDFKVFLREAHRRGLYVITELVLNHTSNQHPWFQRARTAEAVSAARNFYVWSDDQERYRDARIIFKDFEHSNWAWDPVAKAYYWHRFYSHQPDLNFDNADVRAAVFDVVDFWLELGVDGLRLDAVPYLCEREGTNCENLPETHAFLRELRAYVDGKYQNRMLLAEANQWPENAVGYFGAGDECHMAFHFPVMPRLFMALRMEDRFPIIDILEQTPAIPDSCQWALFLRNHDELTLEMVTDEDRDYMYQVYASDPRARINLGIRRRLGPLVDNSRRRMELLHSLLFSLPGTPVIYYGDEIGMGDNIYLGDRNGVRTPMQWSADRNAGFSSANPQKLFLPVIIDPEYHYETVNVEAQQQNPSSFLWWMKRLIVLRKNFQAFGHGTIEFLHPENRQVLVFLRRYKNETILVAANLSRFVNFVTLDLSSYKDLVPVELFGHTAFPMIGELPYFLTFGPHAFYWFKLETPSAALAQTATPRFEPVVLEITDSWDNVFQAKFRSTLERALPAYVQQCRWFGAKGQPIRTAKIMDLIPFTNGTLPAYFTTWEIQYHGKPAETYFVPLSFLPAELGTEIQQANPRAVVAQLKIVQPDREAFGVLCDATYDPRFCAALLGALAQSRHAKTNGGEWLAQPSKLFRRLRSNGELEPTVLKREQSNTSIVYGDRLILKLIRRVTEGVNPDVEISRFLTEEAGYRCTPAFAGAFELYRRSGKSATVGIVHGFVANEGDAWSYALDCLAGYYDDIPARKLDAASKLPSPRELVELAQAPIPESACDACGSFLSAMALLGQRNGELHRALASDKVDPAFAPEPLTALSRRSLYQSLRSLTDQSLNLLARRLKTLPEPTRLGAEKVVKFKNVILTRICKLLDMSSPAMRIRCHGDFHLGQVLFTGKDFVIIDFEGEPASPLSARRLKRLPLRDVAGMLRSISYAATFKLKTLSIRPEDAMQLRPWAHFWTRWVSTAYLKGYLEVATQDTFLPTDRGELGSLLEIHLLEKGLYELAYELNNRPDFVDVPIEGILEILDAEKAQVEQSAGT